MTDETLVACDYCGAVYQKANVPTRCCPTCDTASPDKVSVPKLGRVNKWWSEI